MFLQTCWGDGSHYPDRDASGAGLLMKNTQVVTFVESLWKLTYVEKITNSNHGTARERVCMCGCVGGSIGKYWISEVWKLEAPAERWRGQKGHSGRLRLPLQLQRR